MKLLLTLTLMLACSRAMGFAFAPAGVARTSFSTVGALHKAHSSARPAFRSTRLTVKCSWGAEVVWQPVSTLTFAFDVRVPIHVAGIVLNMITAVCCMHLAWCCNIQTKVVETSKVRHSSLLHLQAISCMLQ
jgi:hypothetical protein